MSRKTQAVMMMMMMMMMIIDDSCLSYGLSRYEELWEDCVQIPDYNTHYSHEDDDCHEDDDNVSTNHLNDLH